jgi:SAM-dependent methyltransferase
MNKPVTDSAGWDDLWRANFAHYANSAATTGVFIAHLAPKANSFLELGAGSARDSFYLFQLGKSVTASDFSDEVVKRWSEFYPAGMTAKRIDNFNIEARDGEFDITFHNGLYGYFSDEEINRLIVEQRRVTRQSMMIIVHNKLNVRLMQSAERQRETNPLFRFRFFTPDEVIKLVKDSGISFRNIRTRKFGGPFDRLYHIAGAALHHPNRTRLAGFLVTRLYPLTSWPRVERVCVIVDV